MKISEIPQIKCWPDDGGAFITLPQVYSEDILNPGIMNSNLGMYRIQISGNEFIKDKEIGLHYQIHRGIGIHQKHAVKNGENLFADARGIISNHELTEPINLIGMIESKKGTIRANHYHPQQEQKCLFTKGQIIEIFQDIINPNAPKITQVVNA